MDPDVSRWILEFLLRQPLDDSVLDSLLRILPLPNDNSSFIKPLLLRKIDSEVSKGVVSEKILTLLEQIEELDESEEASDALKRAYCAVAVDCTVRCLKINGYDGVKGDYFDAVKRIWRGRVCKMEKFGNMGLVSEDLLVWRDEIEAALWEESVCENVLKMVEGINAVEALRAFVNAEKLKMGPSFLELVAETLKRQEDDTIWGLIGLRKSAPEQRKASESNMEQLMGWESDPETRKSPDSDPEQRKAPESDPEQRKAPESDPEQRKAPSLSSADKGGAADTNITGDVQIGNVKARRKHAAYKRPRVVLSSAPRGAKIADVEGEGEKPSCSTTPEVNEVQARLNASRLELQAVVKDPLPSALRVADTVLSGVTSENRDHPIGEDHDRANSPVTENGGIAPSGERGVGNGGCSHQINAPKPSLMGRNHTAHTFEWNDSIDDSLEQSPDSRSRPHLPSPKGRVVSPLKKYQPQKLTKRRKNKKWSLLEEETLRTGVERFGQGYWKLILNAYRDIFEERTEVDLKDKWRNMTRHG